ncbi:MAG: YvcK family protein [Coriobacteriia bacterium]|nr:YvcK family protein [Coriobacteriia bacterium]
MASDPFKLDPALTSTFNIIAPNDAHDDGSGLHAHPKVVVVGGGTGASLSIRTLLSLGMEVAAVVSMADDGGSTGIIRKEAHVSPPGDVRKCLGAMAADQNDPFTHAFRYRFEFARNHTLGNLMLSALEHETGSFPEAVRICEKILKARGHVYPSTLDNVTLSAMDVNGKMLVGQALASHSEHPLQRVWLVANEGCHPYDEALQAIREADAIVLGPGSLFTSVIPNLLVPGLLDAIRESKGKTIFPCNVSDADGETHGFSARDHVEALLAHGMRGLLDYAVIHSATSLKPLSVVQKQLDSLPPDAIRPVRASIEDVSWIQNQGIRVYVRNLSNAEQPMWHNPYAWRQTLQEILSQCLSRPM